MPSIRSRVLDSLTVLVALSAVVASGTVVWSLWRSNAEATGPTGPNVSEAPDWHEYGLSGYRFGPRQAEVVIVEFSDYQCPVCRSFRPVLDRAREHFGDSIAVVYRHAPLERHPMGQVAARSAVCAGRQARFEEYHSRLYRDASWIALGVEALDALAESIEVPDLEGFSRCVRSLEPLPELEEDREAAERLGLVGTPTVLVNAHRIDGAPDSTTFFALIRRELHPQ
jgi:protein-disulfide isomerase